MQKTDFLRILRVFQRNGVEFLIVGGVSAVLHGAPVTTFDLDLLHKRTEENVDRLLSALKELNSFYRMKKDLRIEPDKSGLMGNGHHLLLTDAGALDILCVVGVADHWLAYEDLLGTSEEFEIDGQRYRSQSLESLIELKKSIGRAKDLAVVPLLESTLEEKKQRG